jgi:hypothetical protein
VRAHNGIADVERVRPLRPSSTATDDPSKLARYLSGMVAVGLPLRAFNEGLLRPRVARAQKINRLHPHSAPGAVGHTDFLIALFLSAGGGLAEPPQLRASNEHCFIVRVLRAKETNRPLYSCSGIFSLRTLHLAGGMGRSLTARIEGPLSEVGPLRANGASHPARAHP